MDQQYDRLLMMRRELDRKIHTIAGTRKILDQIRIADVGKPVIRKVEHSLYLMLTEVRSSPATSSGEIAEDIRRHLKCCEIPDVQAFPMGSAIGKEAFMKGIYSYKNVFSFADKKQKVYTEMKPGEYLVAVSRESDGDISRTYRKMMELLQKEKKKWSSDIYILSIVNVIDPNEERKYLKYIFAAVSDL